MAADSCELFPNINGEPSTLYRDLLEMFNNDRKLVNYIYAVYLQSGVAAQMDSNPSYSRNNQNEHNAVDVYNFLNLGDISIKHKDSYTIALKKAGAIGRDGNKVTYKDGKQALERAKVFNDSDLGRAFVASVFQHNDEFQIYVERKDSMSIEEAGLVNEQLNAWNTVTQAFNSALINIDDLHDIYPNLVNPIKVIEMLDWLNNLKKTAKSNIDILSKKDLQILLTLNQQESIIQRLLQKYNDIDTVASELYNYLKTGQASQGDAVRFDRVSSILPNLGGLDIEALIKQVEDESSNLRLSDKNFLVSETIKNFGDKINPNLIDDMGELNNKIVSLSDVAIKAIKVLSRELDDAKNEKDDRKALELQKKVSELINQIDGKCYYGGTLSLIQSAMNDVANLMQSIQNPVGGTKLERILATSKDFKKLKDIVDNYYDILVALSDLNKIIINDNISVDDEQKLQDTAKKALSNLNEVREIMDSSRQSLAVDILTEYLGDTIINGVPIAVLASQAAKDTTFLDTLFSSTDISSPLVSAVSTIIRKAQQERDKKVLEFDNRIQRATNRLTEAGYSNQDWMYESDGTIISDINWSSYFLARDTYRKQLKGQGYKGYTLDSMMIDWEEKNTEDRVVDKVSGRTEKVPNSLYRKQMPQLSPAQQEYYDTMLQIKGELGTLLPVYARDYYNPPQIRLGLQDALRDVARNYKGKDVVRRVVKIIGEKFKDIVTWREDDEYVDKNGYYHGGFSSAHANPNGTLKKRIPIFYRGTIEDQSMLDKNFGRAMIHMTTTAINYDAMNRIESAVMYMKDFINNKAIYEQGKNGNDLVDVVEGKRTIIASRIKKLTDEISVQGILNDTIDAQMYGISKFRKNWWTKLVTSILKYNSVSKLAINIKGATVNDIVGRTQTIIEAMGGEFYTIKDWVNAQKEVLNPKVTTEVIADIINGTKLSIHTLLNERFNVQQKIFSNLKEKKYYTSKLNRTVDSISSLVLYEIGEYSIHQINLKAILKNEKVLLDGKKVSLRDVFDKTAPVDGVSELTIKSGATKLDGTPITEEYLDEIMNRVKLVNQEHHGAMSDEDKGVIHRKLLGKLIMNFRQWMVRHYERRYRGAHRDTLTGKEREGFYRTAALVTLASTMEITRLRWLSVKLMSSSKFANRLSKFQEIYAWKNIKDREDRMRIANVKKAAAEHVIALVLLGLWGWLDDDNDDKAWREYQALGVVDRLLTEVLASTPLFFPREFVKLVNSPVPSISTFNNLTYPITGVGDIVEKYKTGRYKGENKYMHNLKYEFIPFTKQIDYFINPESDNTRLRDR